MEAASTLDDSSVSGVARSVLGGRGVGEAWLEVAQERMERVEVQAESGQFFKVILL